MEIRLRDLEVKDAPLMLEWMHDPEIQKAFEKDFMNYKAEDVERFCSESKNTGLVNSGDCVHYAIVDSDDEYLGTISLKDYDSTARSAKYAIATRSFVHGKGVAAAATRMLLDKAFGEWDLNKVYMTVVESNLRAIKFYEKCGFVRERFIENHFVKDGKLVNQYVYGMLKDDYDQRR